jgi:hypothetical protein
MERIAEPSPVDPDVGIPISRAIDTQAPRAERTSTHHADIYDCVSDRMSQISVSPTSPITPGPPSPPLSQPAMTQDFLPPTRPSSTPFPQPEPRSTEVRCISCPASQFLAASALESNGQLPAEAAEPNPNISLSDLPAEIHECILDHLFGFRVSASSKSSITRWGTALRHPRRRELSELALVSPAWRVMIQERLYRHIKLKASIDSLRSALAYFAEHPHLRSYVKHLELWFPVFHPKTRPLALSTANTLPAVTPDGLSTAAYVLPVDNCSLEEAFYFVAEALPGVCVLTLEGGERKKAPKVRNWIRDSGDRQEPRTMPKLESVQRLICKGQWNLIRSEEDFEAIMSALPNLREWHGSYSKPKSKSYLTMADILLKPMSLSRLDLCLEGDYRRELAFPSYFYKVSSKVHFCSRLAVAAASPALQHFSYTGRVCKTFFAELAARQKDPRNARLQSIDLTVKNCCRPIHGWAESSGSGITDMNFINAFEELVLAGIRALGKLQSVEYLRIRYVDLGMLFIQPICELLARQ